VLNGCLFTDGSGDFTETDQPLSLRANNYGNADYDIRSNFSGDFLVNPTIHGGNQVLKAVVNGWNLSGKIYWRTDALLRNRRQLRARQRRRLDLCDSVREGLGRQFLRFRQRLHRRLFHSCINANVYLNSAISTSSTSGRRRRATNSVDRISSTPI